MSASNNDFNPFDPAGMLRDVRDASLDNWAKAMVQFVNTEAYAEATGAMLDAWLTTSGPFRKAIESTITKSMTQLNMPVRDDVTRLAERLTNIEMRLDNLDATLDEILRSVRDGASEHA